MITCTVVGLALAIGLIQRRRSIVIVVTPESLTCVSQGPMGTKERH